MFFVLSKTINYLAQPIVILFLLWIISWILKNKTSKKWIRITALLLTFLFTNEFIANELIGLYEHPVTPLSTINKQYEFGIVLTGVTATNKLVKDRVYVTSSPDRVNHAVMLYKKGVIRKILISGGSGKLLNPSFSEATELTKWFYMMGVDSSALLIEGKSRNTYESAAAVKKMLVNKSTSEDCLLITSGYHMPRSIACFKNVGWNCDTFATDVKYHEREYTPDSWLIPKAEALGTWNILMKEWVGMLAYWVSGYV